MPAFAPDSGSASRCSPTLPRAGAKLRPGSGISDQGIEQARVCLEATGRYSLGLALALHDVGHCVSLVNPAQIRDFARTKLGRNKTDGVDAGLIREYAEIVTPPSWRPGFLPRRRYAGWASCRPCGPASPPGSGNGSTAGTAVSPNQPRAPWPMP
jgi:hypothetical protein